jgi:hypothetical protein
VVWEAVRAAEASSGVRLVAGPIKIRPYDSLPPSPTSPFLCAKNEYCSFQVVVTANEEDMENIDLEVAGLVGPGGARIPADQITLYREGFLNVFYLSDVQGRLGEWPDPLIPRIDPDYKEERDAFPFGIHRISPAYKKYRLDGNGNGARPEGSGAGQAVSGGTYAGRAVRWFVIRIVKPGTVGTATFQWALAPRGSPSPEIPVRSSPTPLQEGVTVAFRSGGDPAQDFQAGDEFWIYAGPFRHQPLWVDVLIPRDARPGLYGGKIQVTANGKPWRTLPFRVEVLDLALPSTSTLPSSFGMDWHGIYRAHYGDGWDAEKVRTLGQLYAKAALRNSITVSDSNFPPVYKFNPDSTIASADFSTYDAAVAPLMDGQGTPRGARWTSLRLPEFDTRNPALGVNQLRRFLEHAKQRGWYGRLFDYTFDEPSTPDHFRTLERRARLVEAADPKVPRLVTTDLDQKLVGLVTRWCPVVNYLDPKPVPWKTPRHPRRPEYEPRLQAGDQLWWYQSCMSHGCGAVGGPPAYGGWPSYMVDASGVANRVFGLMSAVNYRVGGILYWAVTYAYQEFADQKPRKFDVWEVVFYFGGNGDGTLFYPGRPAQIGGKHHIPIESLRLKMIRDSFYDADYAYLLQKLGQEQFLAAETKQLIHNAYEWNDAPEAWMKLREAFARRIVQAKSE